MQKMTVKEEPKREEPPKREQPQPTGKSLGEVARDVFWVMLVLVILAALGGLGYVAYVEFYIVPTLLVPKYGNGAILVHVFAVAGLMVGSAALAGWLQRRRIFQTYQELMAAHTNSTIAAIENLATGRWASDSYTHREAFKTGAVLGYKVGQAESGEPDRNLIVEGIGAMSMPQARQLPGQSADVVTEMDDFVLSARKQRLSS